MFVAYKNYKKQDVLLAALIEMAVSSGMVCRGCKMSALEDEVKYVLGNGKRIRFWHDVLLGECPQVSFWEFTFIQ